jgi:hypothetical protein
MNLHVSRQPLDMDLDSYLFRGDRDVYLIAIPLPIKKSTSEGPPESRKRKRAGKKEGIRLGTHGNRVKSPHSDLVYLKSGGLLTTRLDRMSTCGGTICYYWTNFFFLKGG